MEVTSVPSFLLQIVMSEMIEEAAQCSFGDIAGQVSAKQALQETVILPSLRWRLYSSIWLKLQIVVVCCQQTEKMSTKLCIQAGTVHRTADSHPRFVTLRPSREWEDHAGQGCGQRVRQSFLQHQRQQSHQQVCRGGREAGQEFVHCGQAVSAFHHLH